MTTGNVNAETLRNLHRIQRQLTDLRVQLDHGPKRIRAVEGGAAHQQQQLTACQTELKRMRVAADQKQLQLKAGEEKVKDLKRKLNAAGSNREYQALRDQIAADEMANGVLADEILEAYEQLDQQQVAISETEKTVAAAQQRVAAVRAEVQKEQPRLESELARLEADLKKNESALPDDIADFYRRGVRQKGEDALAAIENGVCGGCHQTVPVNICSQVMLGKPNFCRTCGRLLYMPEDRTPAAQRQAAE